ncbi:helix-turn-helix domain-containing protein [Oceanibium sediminis]|uniref:helix-turn-helix domain-containing protein n=1 Tax=Oceanibium sediminis TaxID=2026339 RepID=UPI000DD2D225|nr:helix-turn-helix transcriptional regulator [Oceanibium sediminis]
MTDADEAVALQSGRDYSDEAATFGDRIVAAREAKGYTTAQLARQLGIKSETLVSWENDRSEPRANKLQILAGMLNVSIVWLMTGQGVGEPRQADGIGAVHVDELLADMREIRALQSRLAERALRLERRLLALKG